MSSYENYTHKSRNYDKTREPVGTEIFVGCFAHAPVPLDRAVVLDAGCGTGNYSEAMLDYVGRIEAVDMNPGMLEVAAQKLAGARDEGRISFHSATDRRAALRGRTLRRGHDQPGAPPPAGRRRRRTSPPTAGSSPSSPGS